MAAAVRINRYLAAAGLGTRREVEGLLRTGRVTLNGMAIGPIEHDKAQGKSP